MPVEGEQLLADPRSKQPLASKVCMRTTTTTTTLHHFSLHLLLVIILLVIIVGGQQLGSCGYHLSLTVTKLD